MQASLNNELKAEILNAARGKYPREMCGLLYVFKGRIHFEECKNLAESNNTFVLDPLDYSRIEARAEIMAVVHSHCNERATPSDADKVSCEASNLPWVICSIPNEEFEFLEPCGFKTPLIGRNYAYGSLDCYSLARDYYKEKFSIVIKDFPRVWKWWERGGNWFLENFESAGFFEVPIDEMQIDDMLLMQVQASTVNHCAIYIGENKIIQHLWNRVSSRDVYGGYWRLVTQKVIRLKK